MILCCGEALIDMLPRQTTEGGMAFQPFPGGAVFNTSIALSRLGAPTGLFTGLSTDLFGQLLEKALADSRVSTEFASRSGRPTTLAFVELQDGQARYAFYDENTSGRMLTEADLPKLSDTVTALFFGGISLMVEPCASSYEQLMLNSGPDRLKMLDPNIRPGFITDETAYRARLERMLADADIVKVSDEDLQWITGPGEIREGAGRILAKGPKLVCVTAGSEGAWAITTDQAIFQPATKVTPVDTVGAGDTFNAGILAALHDQGNLAPKSIASLSEDALTAALSLATRAAAVTVSRAGANPPWRKELS